MRIKHLSKNNLQLLAVKQKYAKNISTVYQAVTNKTQNIYQTNIQIDPRCIQDVQDYKINTQYQAAAGPAQA